MIESTNRTSAALTRRIAVAAAGAVLAAALATGAGGAGMHRAWASVDPGVYTASVTASYANPDDGTIVDSGGQSNATLGQSMVEGVTQPEALVENDGDAEYVTVRFGQADSVNDVRVSADPEHDGTFGAETVCERIQVSDDGKTADYRFEAEDDEATFMFSLYVEPMGRDVSFFVTLSNPVEGNAAGFEQTVAEAQIRANAASAESGTQSAASASASGASADAASPASGASDAQDEGGLNMPLIIGIVVAAVVIIAVVAYFAAIRPGKQASKAAAEEAAKRERLKRS